MLKMRTIIVNLAVAALALGLLASCAKDVAPPSASSGIETRGGYPVERLAESNACYDVLVEYPFLGRPALDQQVRLWVDAQYYDSVEELTALCAESQPKDSRRRYEHRVDYKIFQAPGSISVLFESWTYAGGAHGQNGLQAINLLVKSGEELLYKDLFANTSGLYVFLSDYIYHKLQQKLGDIWQGSPMFTEGLEPVEASFKNFVITQKGLTVYFPPYQIAPYSEGTQSCEVPLHELVRFRPKPGIWQ